MHLDEKAKGFVERMGAFYEHWGMTRTFGHMFGLLIIADEPVSLDELAKMLHVSKAAVSQNVRLYRELGFIRRVKRPGDRRDYYEMVTNSLETATERKMGIFYEMVQIADEGIEAISDKDHPGHFRLLEMRAFYEFVAKNMVTLLSDWRQQKDEILKQEVA